jgi:membrane fusion protein (multidrug efflux system)
MRSLLRHPITILMLVGATVLSYMVYDKATQDSSPGGGFPGQFGSMSPVVGITQVESRIIADSVESIGTTVANESVNLAAAVSETVSRVHFDDGDFVATGDVLVELTNTSETSRLAEAQANVNDARRRLQRIEALAGGNLVAASEFDQARTLLETAEARLEGTLVELEDRLVRAPFSGFLGFRNISAGSMITPATVITTLDDITMIKLDFNIPEIYLADVSIGQSISAKSIVYKDQPFTGTITVVGSRIDSVTRSVSVRAEIPNPDLLLRPGMLLTVSLALNEQTALVVPERSVVASQGRTYVYLVSADNKISQQYVELGRRKGGNVEIVTGVALGQQVVSEGVVSVRPGITVQPQGQQSPNIESPSEVATASRPTTNNSGE